MKSKPCTRILLLPFVLLLVFFACNKGDQAGDDTDTIDSTNTTDSTFNGNNLSVNAAFCPTAPNYGDSVVYLKPKNGGDFFLDPLNNIGVQGTYLSWPEGLKINKNSGTINLSQSETGVRYNIAFVKKGTTDTCVSQLIVGGLTYMDAIYVLEQNDTLAKPVFNANPSSSSICDDSDDTDYPDNNGNGNNKCVFDDDVPGQRANDQKLRVRTKSGFINMKKSFDDGLFGKNPKNGDTKKVQIRYKLNDGSQKASQKLTVQVVYYDKVSSIPVALQQEIAAKRTNMFSYKIVNGKPRPPLLIIAGLAK
ncbi:hypothetical protein [Niastella populi]|nr:hypothetical protein [Niastella populi]